MFPLESLLVALRESLPHGYLLPESNARPKDDHDNNDDRYWGGQVKRSHQRGIARLIIVASTRLKNMPSVTHVRVGEFASYSSDACDFQPTVRSPALFGP